MTLSISEREARRPRGCEHETSREPADQPHASHLLRDTAAASRGTLNGHDRPRSLIQRGSELFALVGGRQLREAGRQRR
jgi:hypothetical protein